MTVTGSRKAVWGWALYDWANSAFATTVMAGFFPIFFKQYWSLGSDINVSTAKLGFANSSASLLVALMAPVLGAIADKGSARKAFLISFAYLGVLSTACLFVVGQGDWVPALLFYALGIMGFSGANVFYDALLPTVTVEEKVDVVSALGFGMGYLGGGLPRVRAERRDGGFARKHRLHCDPFHCGRRTSLLRRREAGEGGIGRLAIFRGEGSFGGRGVTTNALRGTSGNSPCTS